MKVLVMLMLAAAGWSAMGEGLTPLTEIKLKDGRTILANADGMTAYTFDVDTGSTSQCYDACAATWPPIIVPPSTQVSSPLGTTSRRNGDIQLTHNGRPVYLFARDKAPGDIKGDGLQGVWHIVVLK